MKLSARHKDVLERVAKTFIQGFIAGWTVSEFKFEKGALVGAIAAGISAVWNLLRVSK